MLLHVTSWQHYFHSLYYRRMQKNLLYKIVTTLIQICNKNVTDLYQMHDHEFD